MNIQILSDLHLEFMDSRGRGFADSLDSEGVDVLIIAGDTIPLIKEQDAYNFYDRICAKYKHVIEVLGNHSYYSSSFPFVEGVLEKLKTNYKYKNLHILEDDTVTIEGQRFVGTTMWFPDNVDGLNQMYEKGMNDFWCIKDFRNRVYDKNAKSIQFLYSTVSSSDVVVTHHMPSEKSVDKRYKKHALNRFFVCPVDDLIEAKQPKLWVHGHSHCSTDYSIGETRILANPHGYREENEAEFNSKLIVEV